eukprot:CAMPEP_0168590806 /NCGR_PEP_ID=MMETSP0420-20121227/6776_1 /TAXON_ID=498008 /ORGANISM="Pessonella sp." /LENGTH=335 /DNA_ID=CAMNT_0008626513 /DNA_START=80 /DNA_END=1087 /DNA_ORIENTATION=-
MSEKFSTELTSNWSDVRDNADTGAQALKDISSFFAAKIKADEAYAASLRKLCSNPPGSGMFTKEPPITKETKTLREAVMSVLEQTVAIADAQTQMAQKVNEQVVKVLDEFVKSKDSEKKKIQSDGNKLTSDLQSAFNAAKKAKDQYESACKSGESAKANAEKAAAAGDDPKKKAAAAKAEAKAEAAKVKAKQLEDAYKKAVDDANSKRTAYVETDLPAALDALQKLHEERWEQTISVLKFYTSALSAMPSAIEESVSALKDKIETQASLDEDLAEFIEQTKAKADDKDAFAELEFEQHALLASEAEAAPAAEEKKDDDDAADGDDDAADDNDDAE